MIVTCQPTFSPASLMAVPHSFEASFCSSVDRYATFLPGIGLGEVVGPSHVFCGPLRALAFAVASATTGSSDAASAVPASSPVVAEASITKREQRPSRAKADIHCLP